MSRSRKFTRALVSGYAVLGANIVFTLASLPLALHFLSKEEFGLWALVSQVSAYFMLLDLGMSGSIARILIDHKDDTSSNAYGEVIQTGILVLLVQGILIALGGGVISYWLPQLMDVPVQYGDIFRRLVGGQCLVLAMSFVGRIFTFVLQAHQRVDVANYANIAGFIINLGVLWWSFAVGLGLYSLLVATAAAALCTHICCLGASWQLHLLPGKGRWGRPSWSTFRGLFLYGTDVFLLSVGQMLISASQIPVITRTLGLEAAAVWSICSKTFMLVQQVVYRIFDYSAPALSEMMVRGERDRLRARFRDIVILTTSSCVVMGVALALCNRSFIEIWTKGRVAWAVENDVAMACSLIVYSATRCHVGLVGLTKDIRAMKFIYLLEGVAFVSLGALTAPSLGFLGIIVSGIITNLLCSGIYGLQRTSGYLNIRASAVILDWLLPSGRLFLIVMAAACVIGFATRNLAAPIQLAVDTALLALIGAWSVWRVGLPSHLRDEIGLVLGRWRRRFLGRAQV